MTPFISSFELDRYGLYVRLVRKEDQILRKNQ
jgi:hypothetical protein